MYVSMHEQFVGWMGRQRQYLSRSRIKSLQFFQANLKNVSRNTHSIQQFAKRSSRETSPSLIFSSWETQSGV